MSQYSRNKHGVDILVHTQLIFLIINEQNDEEDRVISLKAKINGMKVNLKWGKKSI